MSRSLWIAAALVASFLAGGLLSGVNTQAADDPVPTRYRGQLYPNWKKLGLTDEQVQKIYKIQTEHRAKISALEAQIRQLRKDERSKAETVLTPAQKALLREKVDGGTSTTLPKDKTPPKDKPEVKKEK